MRENFQKKMYSSRRVLGKSKKDIKPMHCFKLQGIEELESYSKIFTSLQNTNLAINN